MGEQGERLQPLMPYVPRLVLDWLGRYPDVRYRSLPGSLVFVDISGFTKLTERLARRGKVGAEEMSDTLSDVFAELFSVAIKDGSDLVKWGGDAILLLFEGDLHAQRACRAAYQMRAKLREIGTLATSAGRIQLRMSVGVNSGDFSFFLVGDPAIHRELLVTGPAATVAARMESAATAGQIAISHATAALLDHGQVGAPVGGDGFLLRRPIDLPDHERIVREPTDLDIGSVLSVSVRNHLLAQRGDSEHRSIAVAFVEFSGTDALMESAGPEALAEALEDCVTSVSRAALEYEVTFFESDISADGGKIMLTAGAPRTTGNNEERMLLATRRILDHRGALSLRIGVNRGRVFTGDFGPFYRRTYSVKGDAINLAARVMGKAQPWQLLATNEVVDHSATAFETESLPPFMVKGKSRPIRAMSVGAVAGRREQAVTRSPLVGREEETRVLTDALDDVRRRAGSLVQIVGEPGIGKSRLLDELVALATAAGIPVISVRCSEYESATPYYPFRLLMRQLLGLPAGTTPDAALQRLTSRVTANAPELAAWLPLLGVLLDIDLPPTRETAELEEEFRKARLEDVVARFLDCVVPTPTLLTFDDGQLMDEATSDLLGRLTADLPARPWLVIVTRREHPIGFVPAPSPALRTIRPLALAADAALSLVRSVAESSPLPAPMLAALAAKSGGNPMFLETLVEAARSSGEVDDLPESIEQLVTTQIDRLSPHDRTVLRYAAVLGMSFQLRLFQDLLSRDDLATGPATLRGLAGFLTMESSGQRVGFRHALMRDVAYEGLSYRRRRELHERVGLALEHDVGEDNISELLSRHFFFARRFDKSWSYSLQAGQRARAKFANREAVEFYLRAVESSERSDDSVVTPAELADTLETVGDLWFTIGLPEKASDSYRRARALLRDDPIHSGELIAKQARIDQRLRKLSVSIGRLGRAWRALEEVDGDRAHGLRSLLAVRYAISRASQGRVDQALVWGDRAVDEARLSADQAALAQAYLTLHGICVNTGRSTYLSYGELALQAFTALEQLPGQAHCLNNLAVEAMNANRWADSADLSQRAAEMFHRIGDTAFEGNALFNRAEILVRQGRLDEARPLLSEALLTARAVSDDELVALVLRESGRATYLGGDPASGLSLLDEARTVFENLKLEDELPATDLSRADAYLFADEPERALELLDQGLVATDEVAAARAHRLRGFALLLLGSCEEAAAELARGSDLGAADNDVYEQALCEYGASLGGEDPDGRADRRKAAVGRLRGLGVVRLPLPGAVADDRVLAELQPA